MMQCAFVTADWIISYQFIYRFSDPSQATYSLLVFQITHDIFPVFEVLIPIWYIMRIHRSSFEDKKGEPS